MVELPLTISSRCKYRPDTFRSKAMWLILGALIGFILTYGFSIWQSNQKRLTVTNQWINAVINEIDYNIEWETNSPMFTPRGDTIPIKRHLSYSALQSFLDIFPELSLDDSLIANSGRVLLELSLSFNQVVDHRNLSKNRWIQGPKGSIESLAESNDKSIRTTEIAVAKALKRIIQMNQLFRETLDNARS